MVRRTLTSKEAAQYTADLENEAVRTGIPLENWVLGIGKTNDIRPGPGPRHAIVSYSQQCAVEGATYGQVLGRVVTQGNGEPYTIRKHDLAGFVCANGYCTVTLPLQMPRGFEPSSAEAHELPVHHPQPPTQDSPVNCHMPIMVSVNPQPTRYPLHPDLHNILSSAYRCTAFDGVCRSMRWNPTAGHIPRGFLGVTGDLNQVELVLVFAEPGDPQPGDHTTMTEALHHADWAFREGSGMFHQNARRLFQLCWPGLTYDQQLRKVWMTESVLCSAEITTGPVPSVVETECASRFLHPQLALLSEALVVALGNKAQKRLRQLGIPHLKAHALAPPGCHQAEAYPSWVRVANALRDHRNLTK